MNVTEAIILAGGKGKRMRSVTLDQYPKSMTKIQDRGIVEWEIEWLIREGVKHVILATGHLGHMIQDKLGSRMDTKFGSADISFSIEKEKLGSGGAFKLASDLISSKLCYVLNGDVICNSKLDNMVKLHQELEALATMFLVPMRSPYGVVEVQDSLISKFVEKPILPSVYIHGGLDIIDQDIFSRFPDKGQMEDTIFVEIAAENRFAAHIAGRDVYWDSIDSEKDYENANTNWPGL